MKKKDESSTAHPLLSISLLIRPSLWPLICLRPPKSPLFTCLMLNTTHSKQHLAVETMKETTERSLIGWPNACIHLMKATQTKKLRDVDEKELLPLAKKIQSDYFYFKRQLKNTSLLSPDLISLFYGYWMNQLVTKELQ